MSNDVSANKGHHDIRDRNSAEANGMHALPRNAERISVFAQACICGGGHSQRQLN